ncbi:MAG: HEAT repeat domain-containing protein [Verrucomicrobiales bacterium]|nr:HEAT repeat domain-containing protein [Verrucomicrobiales bacterium]
MRTQPPSSTDLPAIAPSTPPAQRPVRRFGFGTFLAIAAVSVFVVFWTAAERVARRHRPVIERLERMAGADPEDRRRARSELIAQPRDYAPVLVRILRRGKTRLHTDILPWLDSVPQVARQRARQLQLERNAIEVLQRMGPLAAPAVLPLLAERRFGGREAAIALLRTYGPAASQELIATLNDPDPALRAGAAMALGRFPPAEQGGLASLLAARQDKDPSVRSAVLWALGEFPSHPQLVVPHLVEGLSDPVESVRFQAVQALRGFGPEARPAVPALREILKTGGDELRAEAAMTVIQTGESARLAVPELLDAMRHGGLHAARQSASALIEMDVHTDESLNRLVSLLRARDLTARAKTLDALGGLGARAVPAVPAMVALFSNDDPRDDRPTVMALRNIQPEAIPERFRRGRPR